MLITPLSAVLITYLAVPGATGSVEIPKPQAAVFRFERVALPPASALTSGTGVRPVRYRLTRKPRNLSGAFAGALLGMWAGALAGAALDQSKGDSPGLMGAMIGAPIGATAGGILGWRLVR